MPAVILAGLFRGALKPRYGGEIGIMGAGTLSPRARQEIKKLGIVITENVDENIGLMDWMPSAAKEPSF